MQVAYSIMIVTLFFSAITVTVLVNGQSMPVISVITNGSAIAGETYSLECYVNRTDPLNITWLDPRNNTITTGVVTTDHMSTLMFSPLAASHAGTYTCEVRVGSMQEGIEVDVVVEIPTPALVLITSNVTSPVRPIGSTVSLICIVELPSVIDVQVFVNTVWTGPARFMTTNTGQQAFRSNTTYVSETIVSSFGREQSGTYACSATVTSVSPILNDSDTKTATIDIFIGCAQEFDSVWGIRWPSTPQNTTSTQPCPGIEVSGNAKRFCVNNSQWGEIDVLNCTSHAFIELEEVLANDVLSSLVSDEQISLAFNMTQQLIEFTELQNRRLLPNDLGASARILMTIVQVLEKNNATNEDVIEIFNNVLDDSNTEGWRSLYSAGHVTSSELLLGSAQRYASLIAMAAKISGENTMRHSRLNIVVVGEQYEEPPISDLQFPLPADLVNYTSSEDILSITIPRSLVQERLEAVGDNGSIPVFFLLLHNLPMGFSFSITNVSTKRDNTCTGEQLTTQGATDVLSAQVGSRTKNTSDSQSLQYAPVKLNFTFVTTINSILESYHCVYWNFSEPIGNGSWTTAGIITDDIITERTESGYLRTVSCRSTHLTSFAVLVSLLTCSTSPVTTIDQYTETVAVDTFIGCMLEVDSIWGITWPSTPQDSTSMTMCPGRDVSGNATRSCGNDGQWNEVNILNCTSRELFELGQYLDQEMLNNLEPEQQISVAANVTEQLIQFTEPQNRPLLPTDLGASAKILTAVVDILENNSVTNENVIDVFNNILDDSNREGWRSLQSAGQMISSELLLSSAERYAVSIALSASVSGPKTVRQSRLNIVVVGEQYKEPPMTDLHFPLPADLVNYTSSEKSTSNIAIPLSLIEERLKSADSENIPVFFLLVHNFPASSSYMNTSINTCIWEQSLRIQEATGSVISAQVGSRHKNTDDSESLQYYPIRLNFTFKTAIHNTPDSYHCVYWNFSQPVGNGSWTTAGIITEEIITELGENLTTIRCRSTHLTSFAVLVDVVGGLKVIDVGERKALQIVSYIGCTISILCLIFTVSFFLWLSYEQWRKADRKRVKSVQSFVHLNLAFSLLFALVMFVAGVETATGSEIGCALIAALLHYLFLCAFCWMLCEGILLYLLLCVVFNEMSKKWWPFVLIGYVALTVGLRYEYYGEKNSCGDLLYCWMSVDKGTIFGFVAPMLAIILINIIFMALALQTLWRVKRDQHRKQNESKFQASQKQGRALLVASFVLFPLLGLTWTFGILTVNANSTVFAWLFTIFNSLQGLFILWFHVVRNDKIWSKINPKLYSLRTKLVLVSISRWYEMSSGPTATLLKGNTTKSTETAPERDSKYLNSREGQFAKSTASSEIPHPDSPRNRDLKDEAEIETNLES